MAIVVLVVTGSIVLLWWAGRVTKYQNIQSKYVEVDSNHWNILGSQELADVLHEELPRLINPKEATVAAVPIKK
jgi:hypothetical protein